MQRVKKRKLSQSRRVMWAVINSKDNVVWAKKGKQSNETECGATNPHRKDVLSNPR